MSKRYNKKGRYAEAGPADPHNGAYWEADEELYALMHILPTNKTERERVAKRVAADLNRGRGGGKTFTGDLVLRKIWGLVIGATEVNAKWGGPRRRGPWSYTEERLLARAIDSKSAEWGKAGCPAPVKLADLLYRTYHDVQERWTAYTKKHKKRGIVK